MPLACRPIVHVLRPTFVAAAIAALGLQAHAQVTGTLSEVVVSASGFEQELAKAPASISVITREELQTKQYRDLAEALKDVEGIDVRGSTGKTGGLDISIRGMPSDYTLLLIDGRRQNTGGDVTPNGFGSALTSLIPPVSAIERIEVIRGPMSTLYGSDAMGGVVNIITRKVAKTWGGSVQLQAGIPVNSQEGNAEKLGFYLNGPIKEDVVGLALRGQAYHRDGADLKSSSAGGSISKRGPSPVETDQYSLGARLTVTLAKDHEIWLDAEANRSSYDNSECELGNVDYSSCGRAGVANGYADEIKFNKTQIALGYNTRIADGKLETSVSRTDTDNKGRTIPTDARPARDPSIGTPRKLEATNTIWDAKYIKPLGENHLLTVGTQYWDAKLTDGLVLHPSIGGSVYQQKMWSVFGEDEWRLTQDLTATLGLRYDHHDRFGSHVSPRAYLVWSATDLISVKGGVSRGFRAPRLNQLVDGISGVSGQGQTMTIGNPNLKPEVSTSTELGMLFDNKKGWSGSATLFHNNVKDMISTSGGSCADAPISSCAYNPTATYAMNLDNGKTWGLELSSRWQLAPAWSLKGSYTWTDSEVSTGGKLSDTPEHMGNATLNWSINNNWSAWLQAEYRGKSRRFNGDPADFTGATKLEHDQLGDLRGYGLLHVGAQYRYTKDVTFSLNVNNLLDKDFRKFSTWTDASGATQWGSPYIKSSQATKGFLPSGRALWVTMNVAF